MNSVKVPKTRPHPLSKRNLALLWDAHTAVGVLIGPLLLIIFVTACFVPVQEYLTGWSEPFLRAGAQGPGYAHVFDPVGDAPVDALHLHLLGDAGGLVELELEPPEGSGLEETTLWVDGSTGEWRPQVSEVVHEIYNLHFFYQVPGGIYVAGLVGLTLCGALLSGILVHLRDLVPHFGRLRKRPVRARRADWHTLLGTLLAPWLLILAITGAMLGLANLYVGSHVPTAMDGDVREAWRHMGYGWPESEGDAVPGHVPDLDRTIARAREVLPGLEPHWMGFERPGAEDAVVNVYGHLPGVPALGAHVGMVEATGEVLQVNDPDTDPPGGTVNRWGIALHFGDWGGTFVRLAYIAIALASVGLSLFGMVVWRSRNRKGRFARAVEVLTVVCSVGLLTAIGAALASSQLLPLVMDDSGWWQTAVLFGGWLLTVPVAWAVPASRATDWLLHAAATVFTVAATSSLVLVTPTSLALWQQGRGAVLAVDIGLYIVAMGCVAVALRVRQREGGAA